MFGKTTIDKIVVGSVEDHDDEPSLFVSFYMKADQEIISASQLLDTIAAASTTLREVEDFRFPYVTFLAPKDELAESTRTVA